MNIKKFLQNSLLRRYELINKMKSHNQLILKPMVKIV